MKDKEIKELLYYIEEDSKEENIISIKRKGAKVQCEILGSKYSLLFTFAQLCKELADSDFEYNELEYALEKSKKFI